MTKEKNAQKVEIPSRPARRLPFENPGRLRFPEIPGYTTGVFAMDDQDRPNEIMVKEDQGWIPVRAEEIGYDKLTIRPLKAGDHIIVNLGRNVKGLLMKIPTVWLEEDEKEFVKRNHELLQRQAAKPKTEGSDPNLKMTGGDLKYAGNS